jgi:serine O-acetyltransferase
MNIANFHAIGHKLYLLKIPLLPKVIYYIQFLLFNSSVPVQTKIGKNSKFAYGGIGCVIHARATIGNHCIIGQGITIGGRSKIEDVPVIGDYVYIGAGARILGNVIVGDNVVIGANAVVIHNVPSNCAVAGIPAKIIKQNIKMEDYV